MANGRRGGARSSSQLSPGRRGGAGVSTSLPVMGDGWGVGEARRRRRRDGGEPRRRGGRRRLRPRVQGSERPLTPKFLNPFVCANSMVNSRFFRTNSRELLQFP